MARIPLGQAEELPPGARRLVVHGGIEIGIFNVNGEFRAYRNRCPHQLGPACAGHVTGTLLASRASNWTPQWALADQVLLCPWHQMEFDLTTGHRIRGRGERLHAYRIEQVDGDLYLEL
ncbi:MAG: Rieske 2Fe-2S domain-containing protein [Actinobacteria bacterium]|nr:Rieske 2Fe-2S domain-containing protein [Actinomycetota bacterium]